MTNTQKKPSSRSDEYVSISGREPGEKSNFSDNELIIVLFLIAILVLIGL